MVADNEIDPTLLRIRYLIDCLDTTVEHNDEFHTMFRCIVYSFMTHSVTFFISAGNVVLNVGIELLQELIY